MNSLDSQTSGSADADMDVSASQSGETDGGSDFDFPNYEDINGTVHLFKCEFPGCDLLLKKTALGNHERTHRRYWECLRCIRKKIDPKSCRLYRVMDVNIHFQNCHPEISRSELWRNPKNYTEKCFGEDPIVKSEETKQNIGQSTQTQTSQASSSSSAGPSGSQSFGNPRPRTSTIGQVTGTGSVAFYQQLDIQSLQEDKERLEKKIAKYEEDLEERDKLRERVFNSENAKTQLERELVESAKKNHEQEMTIKALLVRVDVQDDELNRQKADVKSLTKKVKDLKKANEAIERRCQRRDVENRNLRRSSNANPHGFKKWNNNHFNFRRTQRFHKTEHRSQNADMPRVMWSMPSAYPSEESDLRSELRRANESPTSDASVEDSEDDDDVASQYDNMMPNLDENPDKTENSLLELRANPDEIEQPIIATNVEDDGLYEEGEISNEDDDGEIPEEIHQSDIQQDRPNANSDEMEEQQVQADAVAVEESSELDELEDGEIASEEEGDLEDGEIPDEKDPVTEDEEEIQSHEDEPEEQASLEAYSEQGDIEPGEVAEEVEEGEIIEETDEGDDNEQDEEMQIENEMETLEDMDDIVDTQSPHLNEHPVDFVFEEEFSQLKEAGEQELESNQDSNLDVAVTAPMETGSTEYDDADKDTATGSSQGSLLGSFFDSPSLLLGPKRTEKRRVCPVCEKLITCGNFTTHIRTHKSEKPYKCAICDIGFGKLYNLQRHNQTKHNKNKFEIKCIPCNGMFHVLDDFKKHCNTKKHKINCSKAA